MSKFLGNLFEDFVANYLTQKGFKVIARNYHSQFGEIDLIVQKGEKVVVVEVKGGKSLKELPYRVDCWKLKKIFLTFQRWLRENTSYEGFEVIFVTALVKKEKITFRRVYLEDCSDRWNF